ncbi:hypothetical protein ACFV6G_29510 [Streptomyces lavendulae]|uniref:hypothetical protein n=1 Tax=Streptomyces lavendulae TaxID=1914 RepID=UPI0036A8464A
MPKQIRIARLVLFVHCGVMPLLGLVQLAGARAAREAVSPYSGADSWMAPVVDDARRVAEAQVLSAQYAFVWASLYAAVGITLAVRLARGRRAWRLGGIVYGAWEALGGAFTLALASGDTPAPLVLAALAQLAAGSTLIALLVYKDRSAWSARPR